VAATFLGRGGVRVALGVDEGAWRGVSWARRGLFSLAGPTGCYLFTVALVATGLLLGGSASPDPTTHVRVAAGGPAEDAGLRDEDRILSVDAVPTPDWDTLRREIGRHPGQRIDLEVERGHDRLTLAATPNAAGRILVGPVLRQDRLSLAAIAARALVTPFQVEAAAARSFARLLGGRDKPEMSGPVGIVREVDRAPGPAGVTLLGIIASYFLPLSLVLGLALWPRPRNRGPSRHHETPPAEGSAG
jgi:regulator of sigma E protease